MSPGKQTSPAVAKPALATTIKPADLRGILKYVPRFHGQIFVLAIDGSIIADDNFENLIVDIAVLRSLGIKVVIAHGIGRQLRELSVARNIQISDQYGSGVTDAATLDLAVATSTRVSHLLMEGLAQNNLRGVATNSIRALPVGILKGVDHQFTGKVERVGQEFLLSLINEQAIPVVSPIAFDPEGRSLRINSDLLAAELAEALSASKLIYLTPHPGLVINGEMRRQISVDTLRQQIKDAPDDIAHYSLSKATHAVRAVETGTPRVHIVDGIQFYGLLDEIFSNDGVGTLIYGNDYQQIRKATHRDTRFIHSLIHAAVKREELTPRARGAIDRAIDRFYVFEIDENIIACVSLIFYPEKPELAEIGSLYVLPFYANRGIGKKMVDYACLQARERGAKCVVALSTQNFGFFTKVCGFEEADAGVLPETRLKSYEKSGRNPRVLVKNLD